MLRRRNATIKIDFFITNLFAVGISNELPHVPNKISSGDVWPFFPANGNKDRMLVEEEFFC